MTMSSLSWPQRFVDVSTEILSRNIWSDIIIIINIIRLRTFVVIIIVQKLIDVEVGMFHSSCVTFRGYFMKEFKGFIDFRYWRQWGKRYLWVG